MFPVLIPNLKTVKKFAKNRAIFRDDLALACCENISGGIYNDFRPEYTPLHYYIDFELEKLRIFLLKLLKHKALYDYWPLDVSM